MKNKQNQLIKFLNLSFGQSVFRLPNFLLGWTFCLVFIFLFVLAGIQSAKAQVTQCNITDPPEPCTCTVGIPCDVSLTFNTLDPEQDQLQVKFSAQISSCVGESCGYTMQSCQISPPDTGVYTLNDPPLICTTGWSDIGLGPFTANAIYLFNDDGTYISNYEVCDDSGHCSAGQQQINVVVTPGSFTWANPDHNHTTSNGYFKITWHWTAAANASNYLVYLNGILTATISAANLSWEQNLGQILPENYNKPSGNVLIVATRYNQSPISITGGARERYTEAAVPINPTCVANSSQRITWTWQTGGGQKEYFAENTAGDSSWITNTTWAQSGLTPDTQYTTRIIARNNDNEATISYAEISCKTRERAVISATLISKPENSGWYNNLYFNYNVNCIAEEDYYLTKCALQRRTATSVSSYTSSPPDYVPTVWSDWTTISNPLVDNGLVDFSYSDTIQGQSGRFYQYRVEVQDTSGRTAYSAIVPPPVIPFNSEQVAIKIDTDNSYIEAYAIVTPPLIYNKDGLAIISTVKEFPVTTFWQDYPLVSLDNGIAHSGVSRWFLQYRIDNGSWLNCSLDPYEPQGGFSYLQPTITFPTDCKGAGPQRIQLHHKKTYCFRAAARDVAGNLSPYYFNPNNADVCIYYMSSLEPIAPHTPTPADGAVVPASLSQLRWIGCDPDSDPSYYSYNVFLSQPNGDLNMTDPCSASPNCRGSLINQQSCNSLCGPPTNGCSAGYNLTGFNPSPKQIYRWGVSAKDTFNTVYSQPITGWRFTINTPPQIQNVIITRSPGWPSNGGDDVVNGQAIITWEYRDSDNDPNPNTQLIRFNITYGSAGAGKNIVLGIPSNDPKLNCSGGNGSTTFRKCTYLWNSLCAPAAVNQRVQVEVDDGVEKTAALSNQFTIDHIMPYCYPGPGNDPNVFLRANDGETYEFTIKSTNPVNNIEQYSLIYTPDNQAPKIRFKGVCAQPSTSHTADANAIGNAAVYNQPLNQSTVSPPITLLDLIADNNQPNRIKFTVNSCNQVDYNICYKLASLCDEPYVSVEEGSIYSQGNIRAEYTPPPGSFNATYFVLGGGTEQQTRVIENFISASPPKPGLSFVDPSFGQIVYPGTTATPGTQKSTFDYYGLTHNLAGIEAVEGKPNIYGNPVWVWSENTPFNEIVREGDPLRGRVLRIKGDLVIRSPVEFANGRENSGAGLIIVDGDLYIRANLSYEPALPKINARELASVGWLVLGNVEIDPGVSQVVGSFFVAGITMADTGGGYPTPRLAGGIFRTGGGNIGLRIYGAVIAREFKLERTASAGGEPSEKIIADGRISLNTPPGFKDIMSTLPSWQFRTPLPPVP